MQRSDIERGFALLNGALARDQRRALVNLVGGAVMLLVHDVRPKTQDIDGWIAPENYIEDQVREIGTVLGDERWLNEQAVMYLPDLHPGKGDWVPYRTYSHLIVQTADERTMFAMKALALRGAKDLLDFQYLAELLQVRTWEDAAAIIGRYYRLDSLTASHRRRIQEALDGLPA